MSNQFQHSDPLVTGHTPFLKVVEKILPHYFIVAMMSRVGGMDQGQWPYTPDPRIMRHFSLRIQQEIQKVDQQSQILRATTQSLVADTARTISRGMSPDDPRDGVLVALGLLPSLAENGLNGTLDDPDCKLALQEIQDLVLLDRWKSDQKWIKKELENIIMRLRLLGYYKKASS